MTQSFALMMRDRALEVLAALNVNPAGTAVGKARAWKLRPEAMPALLTFLHTEEMVLKGMGSPPQFTSKPVLVFDLYLRGDASDAIEAALDAWRSGLIEALMTSTDFLAPPLEAVTKIESQMMEREEQHQYQRAMVAFTLQTSEYFEPIVTTPLAQIRATVTPVGATDPAGEFRIDCVDPS